MMAREVQYKACSYRTGRRSHEAKCLTHLEELALQIKMNTTYPSFGECVRISKRLVTAQYYLYVMPASRVPRPMDDRLI